MAKATKQSVILPDDLLKRVDAWAARANLGRAGGGVLRARAIRTLVEAGLRAEAGPDRPGTPLELVEGPVTPVGLATDTFVVVRAEMDSDGLAHLLMAFKSGWTLLQADVKPGDVVVQDKEVDGESGYWVGRIGTTTSEEFTDAQDAANRAVALVGG